MGLVVKRPSRMQGQCLFLSWAGQATFFGRVINFPGRLPPPGSDTPKVHTEGLNVRLGIMFTDTISVMRDY